MVGEAGGLKGFYLIGICNFRAREIKFFHKYFIINKLQVRFLFDGHLTIARQRRLPTSGALAVQAGLYGRDIPKVPLQAA
ncbi:MAG: hypothetical protein OXD30_07100 [Bryobacterales bacterium]|nr:hypothetical protein [Bryobacterales bacterium]